MLDSAYAYALHAHLIDGSPLSLRDLVQTSFFRAPALEGTEATPFSLGLPGASFPLLSYGDHPATGLPCWYLHPCETASAVEEVMSEVKEAGWTEEMLLSRWLEARIMIVGTVDDWVE